MFVFRDPLLEFLILFFITKPDRSAYPSHIARELAQSRARTCCQRHVNRVKNCAHRGSQQHAGQRDQDGGIA